MQPGALFSAPVVSSAFYQNTMALPNKVKLMKNSKMLMILYPSFISINPNDFPSKIASFIPEPITTTISITARTINGNEGGKLYNIPTVHNEATNSLSRAAMIRLGTNMDFTLSSEKPMSLCQTFPKMTEYHRHPIKNDTIPVPSPIK
jgi:hypothetical protein